MEWDAFSLRFAEAHVRNIIPTLLAITDEQGQRMQERARCTYELIRDLQLETLPGGIQVVMDRIQNHAGTAHLRSNQAESQGLIEKIRHAVAACANAS